MKQELQQGPRFSRPLFFVDSCISQGRAWRIFHFCNAAMRYSTPAAKA
jgi:hypothetical protein